MLLWLPLYIWRGQSKQNGHPLCVAYVGGISKYQYYYSELMFNSKPEISYEGRIFFSRIIWVLRKKNLDCAMIIWEPNVVITWYQQNKLQFVVPNWIKMKIDISQTMHVMIAQSRSGYRNISRLIHKYEYTFTCSKNSDDFIYFYENMYLPYSKRRFGESASLWPYSEVFDSERQPELFLVRKQTNIVAGIVVKYSNNNVILCSFGVTDNYFDFINKGLLGSAFYYVITTMQDRGYKQVFIGDSRPFINDGVTRFKIRLLATLEKVNRDEYYGFSIFSLLHETSGIKDFLLHNPFIYFSRAGELKGALWVSESEEVNEEGFQKAYKRMESSGIEHCDIFAFQPVQLTSYMNHENSSMSTSIHNANEYFITHE
jgi:hypothetical protein